jgi:hypothetical protein
VEGEEKEKEKREEEGKTRLLNVEDEIITSVVDPLKKKGDFADENEKGESGVPLKTTEERETDPPSVMRRECETGELFSSVRMKEQVVRVKEQEEEEE